MISAEWAGAVAAVLVGIGNLAVTLGLDRRRQHERTVERRAREAQATFEQDVRAPLRASLQGLEELSARILQAAGWTVPLDRQKAAKDIFENHKTQVLAAFDRPLESARRWSSEGHDHYIRRLRDIELQMDSTLRELANDKSCHDARDQCVSSPACRSGARIQHSLPVVALRDL